MALLAGGLLAFAGRGGAGELPPVPPPSLEPGVLTNLTEADLIPSFSSPRWRFITNFTEITRRPMAVPVAQPSPEADAVAGKLRVGRWIWTSRFIDRQSCRFWRTFTLPADKKITRATLRMTADDYYRVLLDGQEIGMGANWRVLNAYDVLWLMSSGTHVLAVEAHNEDREAGMLAGLEIEFEDGTKKLIVTDDNWLLVPNEEADWLTRKTPPSYWRPAKEVAVVGQFPRWQVPQAILASPTPRPKELRFWQRAWFVSGLVTICCAVLVLVIRQRARLAVQKRAQRMLETERARIARDIHDDLGAMLTQLVLQSEVALTGVAEELPARAQFGQLAERARGAAHALDDVVWAVNSRRDTVRDFASHLCKFAQTFLEVTPIRCRLDMPAELPDQPFALAVRRGLFLAVKETLNNAAKHSQATELFLRMQLAAERITVVVEDNGRGFDIAHAGPERNGLTNLGHRLRELHGEFRLISQPGAGCRVELSVPLTDAASDRAPFWKNLREKFLPPRAAVR